MYVLDPGDPSPPSTSNFIPEFPRTSSNRRPGRRSRARCTTCRSVSCSVSRSPPRPSAATTTRPARAPSRLALSGEPQSWKCRRNILKQFHSVTRKRWSTVFSIGTPEALGRELRPPAGQLRAGARDDHDARPAAAADGSLALRDTILMCSARHGNRFSGALARRRSLSRFVHFHEAEAEKVF